MKPFDHSLRCLFIVVIRRYLMNFKATMLALGMLALTAIGNGAAMASELYPGSNCQTFYGQDASKVVRISNGLNAGSPTFGNRMPVTCPIVRANVDSTEAIHVFARIHSFNGSIGTTCRIVAADWRGQNERVGSPVTVSGANNFQGVDVFGPTSHAGGTLSLFCDVPQSSRIVNYFVK